MESNPRLIPAARAAGIVILLVLPSVEKGRRRTMRLRALLNAEQSEFALRINSADSVMTTVATALLQLSSERPH